MEYVDRVFWKKGVFKDCGIGRDEYLMVKWWERDKIISRLVGKSPWRQKLNWFRGHVLENMLYSLHLNKILLLLSSYPTYLQQVVKEIYQLLNRHK